MKMTVTCRYCGGDFDLDREGDVLMGIHPCRAWPHPYAKCGGRGKPNHDCGECTICDLGADDPIHQVEGSC